MAELTATARRFRSPLPSLSRRAINESDSHSYATQGEFAKVMEITSRPGTQCCKTYWPVTICHPVEPSKKTKFGSSRSKNTSTSMKITSPRLGRNQLTINSVRLSCLELETSCAISYFRLHFVHYGRDAIVSQDHGFGPRATGAQWTDAMIALLPFIDCQF